MFETLFGAELPLAVRFFVAFLIVLVLIVATFWLIRRFGGSRLGASAPRGRQPRLAVIDAAAVDGRRRLVLIRRDNVEHLLMIGGPSDLVIEQNIVRAVPVSSPRDLAASRPPAIEPTPRAPEPAPPRAASEIPSSWTPETIQVQRPQRPAELPHRVAAAEQPARLPAETEIPSGRPAVGAPAKPAPEPVPEPEEHPAPPLHDIGLTDMAQRLEAVLRRPMPPSEPRTGAGETSGKPSPAAETPARPSSAPPSPPTPASREPVRAEPGRPPVQETPHAPTPEAPPRAPQAEPKPASPKSVLDSLEQEMASLLGRPVGKE